MSFRARLERVQASLGASLGRCPGCRLRTQDRGYIVVDGKDPVASLEVPEVCPECGRNTRLHIVVVYEGEGG